MINSAVRSLLFQAQLPSSFWVDALHTTVHILNILPSKMLKNITPYSVLFKNPAPYSHLKILWMLSYHNLNHFHLPKLFPHSSKCFFLVILEITKDICASICLLRISSFHVM